VRVFLDVNIFMYAAGRPHPYKEASQRILRQVAQGEADAVSDSEVLQELLYRYWHLRMLKQGLALVDHAVRLVPEILPVGKVDIVLATALLGEHPGLQPRDAVHAAVMLNNGITRLYSYDHHFDVVAGLKRLEP